MPIPAFKPPDARADIPCSCSPPFPTNSTPTPVGNELIVCNLPFDGPSAPVTTVKEAVMALLQRYPQLQKVMPVAAQHNNANYCYLKLDTSISRTLIQPCPGLLHEWIQPLHKYNADWNIAWSPQKSKDCCAWVQVIGVGCNFDGSGEVTLDTKKEVVKYAISKGIAVLGSWSMPRKISLILQMASQVKCSLSPPSIFAPSLAKSMPNFGTSSTSNILVLLRILAFAAAVWKVLTDHEKIAQDFKAHSLNPPMLIYNYNTHGLHSQSATTEIHSASVALDARFAAFETCMDAKLRGIDMRVVAQLNEMTQISHNLASVSTILSQLSQNVTQIDYYMHAQHDKTHYRILVMDADHEIEKMEARLAWVDEETKLASASEQQ
ncbi:hypothetical protein L208DRAFT_1558677 [Tricholoma matsutake]|nr:hypothetical protein L208DRAFT_1558677 [Tricholoma matsutake 945]